MIYADHGALIFVGATSEVETLKKALAEAKKKAAKEQDAREKHEAKVGEVQQDLQDAVKKYESLERHVADQDSKLTKARQSTHDLGLKSRAPSRKSRRPEKSQRVRPLLCRANTRRKDFVY